MTEQTGPTADPLRTDQITELDVALRDGGVLHVYDTGPSDDAAALPVLWHHGTPNTGHPPAPLFDTATALGLRWVGYDRPGYGGSTPAPDRPVSSAATYAEAVADALGLDRFAVMGHSGGGPHALACAAMLPSRVVAAVAVASLAPYGPEGLEPAAYTAGMAASGVSALRAAVQGRAAKEAHESEVGEAYDPEFRAIWR
ncbi:MAG: alpha/beta hydrolase, partial [Actinomycetota bacterium]|nr:alpha/beta hydrolase [Actinomycetota bacterium]